MPVNNSRLVFALGNQWRKEKDAAPFFGLAAWWRRFMFQILTPREIGVYLYLCSVMDPNAVAYPTVEQIAEDMAVKSRSVISNALDRLVETGFLLRGDAPYQGRYMGRRVVYQRPLPHHTILELLKLGLIDEDLYPTANKTRNRELTKSSDEVVRAGLRRVLGQERFTAYDAMKTPDRRKRVMIHALEEHLAAATRFDTPQERETRIDLTNVLGLLSPEVRKVVEEELDELDEVPF